MSKSCLCLDVGGTSIKYALVDESLELREHGKVQTPYEGVEAYLSLLAYICRMTFGGMPEPQVATCKYFNEANLLGAYANYLDHTRE